MAASGRAREGGGQQPGPRWIGGAGLRGRLIRFRRDSTGEVDPVLLERRPLYFAALALAVMSLIVRQPLLFVAGLLVFVVAAVPEIWYRFGTHDLMVERTLGATRANPGDMVEVRLVIENRKPLPLPWIEVEDSFPGALRPVDHAISTSSVPGRALKTQTTALWMYQRLRRRHRVRPPVRGVFHFGPLKVRVSDPFGMLTREVTLDSMASLIVHPLVVPLQRFGLAPQSPFGEHKSAQRLLEDPLRMAGTRPYVLGDEPRRIHWKATARTGSLQSKVYEPSTRHALVIYLEVRTYPRMLMGYDEDLFELLACAAASVANWSLEQGHATGIYSNGTMATLEGESAYASGVATTDGHGQEAWRMVSAGSPRLKLHATSRGEQLMRILDGIARLLPYYGLPMDQVILAEQRRLPIGATVVYLGTEAAVDVPLIVALRQLRAHGHAVSLLLARSGPMLGDDSGDVVHISDLPVHLIGGREEWRAIHADAMRALEAETPTPTPTLAHTDIGRGPRTLDGTGITVGMTPGTTEGARRTRRGFSPSG